MNEEMEKIQKMLEQEQNRNALLKKQLADARKRIGEYMRREEEDQSIRMEKIIERNAVEYQKAAEERRDARIATERREAMISLAVQKMTAVCALTLLVLSIIATLAVVLIPTELVMCASIIAAFGCGFVFRGGFDGLIEAFNGRWK